MSGRAGRGLANSLAPARLLSCLLSLGGPRAPAAGDRASAEKAREACPGGGAGHQAEPRPPSPGVSIIRPHQ